MWRTLGWILALIVGGIAFTVGAKAVEHYWPPRTPGEKHKDGEGFPRTQKG
jgi:hypothetical protein